MKISTAIGALALSAGGASAADLPVKARPISPPVEAAFDWSGFYIGGHAGCSNGCNHDESPPAPAAATPAPVPPPPPPTTTEVPNPHGLVGGSFDPNDASVGSSGGSSSGSSLKGFIGGVHAGYNYQLPNRVVLGVEGDVDYTDMKASASGGDPAVVSGQLGFRTFWQGSFRGRAGYAFDRLLVYATGGLAIAEGTLSASSVISGGVPLPNIASTRTHLGWTAGGGAEYAFTNHWLGRAEVRYTDFQSQTYTGPIRPISAGWHQVSGTLGIGYKF